jgi:hypothetical protein
LVSTCEILIQSGKFSKSSYLETGQQPLVLSSETVLEAVVVLAAALEVRKELPEVQAAELRKSGRMRRRSHWARKLEHLYSAKKVLKLSSH